MDFLLNGAPQGAVAQALLAADGNVNAWRPWVGVDADGKPNGKAFMTINENGKPKTVQVNNANATLRKNEWLLLDTAVIKAAQLRLRAVADLRSRGLTYNVPGMSKTILESEAQSDITAAMVSMDALRESDNDRPLYSLVGLPLPIIHKDFKFSARQIQVSRNGGTPLDTSMAELAARKVAEEAEKMLLGISTDYTYGGYTIQGYTTATGRMTKVLTVPTATGWTPSTFLAEVIAMKAQSVAAGHYGPWVLYVSPSWDSVLDGDFSTLKGDITVRDRLLRIEGISAITTLDFLTSYIAVLVQMTSDVVREVIGMDITTVQWETHGGMQLHFKVMAIMVPQVRGDFYGNTGIVHGATP